MLQIMSYKNLKKNNNSLKFSLRFNIFLCDLYLRGQKHNDDNEELTKHMHLSCGMLSHVLFTALHNSATFLGFSFATPSLTFAHKFSMGFRSGDCTGYSSTSILLVANQFFANLLVCLGTLSCWNVQVIGMCHSA